MLKCLDVHLGGQNLFYLPMKLYLPNLIQDRDRANMGAGAEKHVSMCDYCLGYF